MLTKSLFRENASVAFVGLWYFTFLMCVRFVTLPLAYPNMGMKAIAACLILAAALWVFMLTECKATTGEWFQWVTLACGLDESRPWTSWLTLAGPIIAAMSLIYSINQVAAAYFAQLEQPPMATNGGWHLGEEVGKAEGQVASV